MVDATPPPLSGRRAEAARNNPRILEAARETFIADPNAPIGAVAKRAGVGISAVYRRYGSKDELLRQLNREGLRQYIAVAEAALADQGDPWKAFVSFMHGAVEADTHSLTQRLAGTFTPTEDLYRESVRARDFTLRLLNRAQSAGAIRPDVVGEDLGLLFEQLASVRVRDPMRTRQLRKRCLALILEALHASASEPLPGPPPTELEMTERWNADR